MQTTLLFGIHCHQPVDNFDWVLEEAIKKSYKPFFQILKEFPDFKCSVHYSGWLLEFIEKNDPELFALMQSLSDQLEFFSGGFYEPVLASIPSKDRIAQINKLNRYIKKNFNQQPKGLWLTERVWDNTIISDLKACGIEYVIVDDYHIVTSGVSVENHHGYFLTEEGGETMAIFPINQALRYAIPFYSLEQTNQILNSFANKSGKNAAIIFDDGEKFGIWPKTYETVYEKNWLRDFFTQTLVDKNIVVQTFQEYFSKNQPIALTYLPTVSYFEMGEWSLNSKDASTMEKLSKANQNSEQFIRGGTWKNFLTKYQESNWIHKRFLELSSKQTTQTKYKDALYKAQCNDVLWHGVFGGIYLPNLRDNAYKYIIECEKLLEHKKERFDIDLDGYEEIKYNTGELLFIISSKNGGQIFELDILDKNFNIQNTLTRYEEVYHKKIEVKSQTDIEKEIASNQPATIHDNKLTIDENIFLKYDWYFKKSAIDHIVSQNTNLSSFSHNVFDELSDFANQPYEIKKAEAKKLELFRAGGVYTDKKYDTNITKQYKFYKNKIELEISLETLFQNQLQYIQEWNLHFASLEDISLNGVAYDTSSKENAFSLHANSLSIKDNYLGKTIQFEFEKEIDIYILSLNSVSQNEQGIELTNQGLTLCFVIPFQKELTAKVQFEVLETF